VSRNHCDYTYVTHPPQMPPCALTHAGWTSSSVATSHSPRLHANNENMASSSRAQRHAICPAPIPPSIWHQITHPAAAWQQRECSQLVKGQRRANCTAQIPSSGATSRTATNEKAANSSSAQRQATCVAPHSLPHHHPTILLDHPLPCRITTLPTASLSDSPQQAHQRWGAYSAPWLPPAMTLLTSQRCTAVSIDTRTAVARFSGRLWSPTRTRVGEPPGFVKTRTRTCQNPYP
jgi:hypothetical protein